MSSPPESTNAPLAKNLRRAERLTFVSLTLERAAALFWRAFVWAAFFCGLWLFEIPARLGGFWAIGAFIVFLLGLIYFHYRDLRFFKLPRKHEIRLRLEKRGSLKHRPLTALEDGLSNPRKTDTRALWDISRIRALAEAVKIKAAMPRPLMAKMDPFALRFAVLGFFALGLLAAGPDAGQRLWRGLAPFGAFKMTSSTASGVRIVITPPAYTGLQTVILDKSNGGKHFNVAEGSALKAFAHGGIGTPVLKADGKAFAFKRAEEDRYSLEMPVPRGGSLKITQLMFPRASWSYEIVSDAAPEMTVQEPEIVSNGALRFPVTLKDDYGVKTMTMRMELGDITPPPGYPGKNFSESRSVMSPAGKPLDIKPVYDLTWHPWAGMPVKFIFEAEDGAGRKTTGAEIKFRLPKRNFKSPLARQIIALREKLFSRPLSHYGDVRIPLENILLKPDAFKRDIVVALALRSAASRLYWADKSAETAQETGALLWDTALRLEDGDLSIAARNLRAAKSALEEALKNPDTSPEEISRLMSELRAAMADYLTELAREMHKRMEEGQPVPLLPAEAFENLLDPESLAAMMAQMESQMLSGDRDAARKMLAQLQNMMNAMDPSAAALPPEMQKMLETQKQLRDLIQRQQALLEKTKALSGIPENAKQEKQNFGEPIPENPELLNRWGLNDMPPPLQGDAKMAPSLRKAFAELDEQESLRHALGELMLEIADATKKIPGNLSLAEKEMRSASKSLGAGNTPDAATHQEAVLEYLKKGQQEIAQQIMAQMRQMTGLAFGGLQLDPLGRPYGPNGQSIFPGSNVKIPDEKQRKKAQEILRLLQKRSGELDRPRPELEYFRRLLRRF